MKPAKPEDIDARAREILGESDEPAAPAKAARPVAEEAPRVLTDEEKERVAMLRNKLTGRAVSSIPVDRAALKALETWSPDQRTRPADDEDGDARKEENDKLALAIVKRWEKEIPERQLLHAMTDNMSGARYFISVVEDEKTHHSKLQVEIMLPVADEQAGQSPLHNYHLLSDIKSYLREKRIQGLREGTHELGVFRAGRDDKGQVIYRPALRAIPIDDGIDAEQINRSLEDGHITLTTVVHERIKRSKGYSEDVDMKLTLKDSKWIDAGDQHALKNSELGKLLLKIMQLPVAQRGKFFIQGKAKQAFPELEDYTKEPVKPAAIDRTPELLPDEPTAKAPHNPLNDDSQEIPIGDYMAKIARFNHIKGELRKGSAYAARLGGRDSDAAHEKGKVLISINLDLPTLTADDRQLFLDFVSDHYGADRVRALPDNKKIYIASNVEIPASKNPQAFVTENKQRIIAEEFGLLLGAGKAK